jgi:hypothetical protein
MLRMIVGVALGLVLGLTVSAMADLGSHFYTVQEIQGVTNTDFQNGYAAGVFDTTEWFAKAANDGNGINSQKLVAAANCLEGHTSPNLGAFRTWAQQTYPKYKSDVTAAAAVISECIQ